MGGGRVCVFWDVLRGSLGIHPHLVRYNTAQNRAAHSRAVPVSGRLRGARTSPGEKEEGQVCVWGFESWAGKKGRGGGQVCNSRPISGRVSLSPSRGGATAGNEPLPPSPPRGRAAPAPAGGQGSGRQRRVRREKEKPFPRSLPPENFSLSPVFFSWPRSPPPSLHPPP